MAARLFRNTCDVTRKKQMKIPWSPRVGINKGNGAPSIMIPKPNVNAKDPTNNVGFSLRVDKIHGRINKPTTSVVC